MINNDLELFVLPYQTAPVEKAYQIKLQSAFEKITGKENPNLGNINKARHSGCSEVQYENLKTFSHHIFWGITPGDSANNSDIKSFTNLVYIDVDIEEGLSKDEIYILKNRLIKLPFVFAVWSSFGGGGIGFLVYVPSIKSELQYNQAYEQICLEVKHKTGLCSFDSKCKNPNRKNTLSFDKELFRKNENEIIPFEPVYNNDYTKQEYLKIYGDIQIDSELKSDADILDKYDYLNKSFYANYIFTDKSTGIPLTYSKDFIFNEEKHSVEQFFDKSIIASFEHKNDLCSLAYNPDGFQCIKTKLDETFYFPHKRRRKSLTAIMLNILFINKIQNINFSKNEIYNMLLILNTRCVKSKPKKGEAPMPYLLDENEINLLTTKLWIKYKNNLIKPLYELNGCKSIRTSSFVKEWLNINPEYTGDKHPRTIILNAIHKIKCNKTNLTMSEYIVELANMYPNLKSKDYIEIMSIEKSMPLPYAKKVYYKVKKELPRLSNI